MTTFDLIKYVNGKAITIRCALQIVRCLSCGGVKSAIDGGSL
jgi:hypothetical protein